jgi:ABC-type nitrate/sulfonate/bicarbonate transport system substrate-binding protein
MTSRRAGVGPALLLLAAALLAGGAGCGRAAARPRHVVLGVSKLRISQPVFLAAQRGLFARHGLDVELRVYDTAQPLADDVMRGALDAGGYVAYPIVFLASQHATRPPRAATSLVEDRDHRLSYVLARPGAGLRFPRDAGGRTIGILPTVAYRRWLEAILRAAGVDPARVVVVPVQPALQAQTLAEGGVDLMFTNDPMATAMLAGGLAEIVDDGPPCATRLGEPFAFGTFLVSGALAADRPDDAARLIAAIDEAILIMRAEPGAGPAAMAGVLRPEGRGVVDRYPPSRYLTSSETPPDGLAAEIGRERALGILDVEPRVEAWSPPRR